VTEVLRATTRQRRENRFDHHHRRSFVEFDIVARFTLCRCTLSSDNRADLMDRRAALDTFVPASSPLGSDPSAKRADRAHAARAEPLRKPAGNRSPALLSGSAVAAALLIASGSAVQRQGVDVLSAVRNFFASRLFRRGELAGASEDEDGLRTVLETKLALLEADSARKAAEARERVRELEAALQCATDAELQQEEAERAVAAAQRELDSYCAASNGPAGVSIYFATPEEEEGGPALLSPAGLAATAKELSYEE
jgi:hypothetical protein